LYARRERRRLGVYSAHVIGRWAKSHPWAASYAAVIAAVVAFMVLAAVAGFADSAVVLFALCAVAMGGFLLDHLKNGEARRSRAAGAQSSQRAQTE
jgi:hypothetical protein